MRGPVLPQRLRDAPKPPSAAQHVAKLGIEEPRAVLFDCRPPRHLSHGSSFHYQPRIGLSSESPQSLSRVSRILRCSQFPVLNQTPWLSFAEDLIKPFKLARFQQEPADSLGSWRNLSRLETIFYLNCGGVVGLWLEDLRRQGFIQTRQKRRRALSNDGRELDPAKR